jgi:beta-lactamase superfamily II metal-dependent hydrolase
VLSGPEVEAHMILEVAFLDVGHGDCAVVTFSSPVGPDGRPGRTRCIVIDGGDEGAKGVQFLSADDFTAAQRLDAYLKLRGIHYIDLMIATHIDADHIGGLVTFLRDLTGRSDAAGQCWNTQPTCIGQYWGPPADENWALFGPGQTDERRRYTEAVKLLVKLKLKKRQQLTAAEQAEIERLEAEIKRLQDMLGQVLDTHAARAHLCRSIGQNAALAELLRAHVADPERNILHPDLLHPPVALFQDLEVNLLWPDIQIVDTLLDAAYLRPVNVRVDGGTPDRRRPADVLQLLERVLDNQERLAREEDRKANNRSLVVSICPTQWAGSAETRPVFLFAGDAEGESWEQMVRAYRDGQLAAHILKVPHHGSAAANGLTPEAFAAIRPRFAVISVGQIHRLPSAETLNLLRTGPDGTEPHTDVFCTERNHNARQNAACCLPPDGCVRKNEADYRSVVFSFNTETGEAGIVQLQLAAGTHGYELRPSPVRDPEVDHRAILWCRQRTWQP